MKVPGSELRVSCEAQNSKLGTQNSEFATTLTICPANRNMSAARVFRSAV